MKAKLASQKFLPFRWEGGDPCDVTALDAGDIARGEGQRVEDGAGQDGRLNRPMNAPVPVQTRPEHAEQEGRETAGRLQTEHKLDDVHCVGVVARKVGAGECSAKMPTTVMTRPIHI